MKKGLLVMIACAVIIFGVEGCMSAEEKRDYYGYTEEEQEMVQMTKKLVSDKSARKALTFYEDVKDQVECLEVLYNYEIKNLKRNNKNFDEAYEVADEELKDIKGVSANYLAVQSSDLKTAYNPMRSNEDYRETATNLYDAYNGVYRVVIDNASSYSSKADYKKAAKEAFADYTDAASEMKKLLREELY